MRQPAGGRGGALRPASVTRARHLSTAELELGPGPGLVSPVDLVQSRLLLTLAVEAAGRRQAGSEPFQALGAQIQTGEAAAEIAPRPPLAAVRDHGDHGQGGERGGERGQHRERRRTPAGGGQAGGCRQSRHRERGHQPGRAPYPGSPGPRRGDQARHGREVRGVDAS